MVLTESLRLVIDARTEGAVRGLKAVDRELDLLEKDAKKAGVAFDRVAARNQRLGGFQKSLDGVSSSTGIATERLSAFAETAAFAGAAAVGAFGVKSVQAASALNEQVSKTKVVFGEASNAVLSFSRNANSIGLSDRAAAAAASTFGTLFVNVGETEQKSADMSVALTKLGADLASFNNTSLEEALGAIQSGLNGEAEPLRRFGVFLNDATLKAEALKQGLISTTTAALTPQQRALSAYAVILQQTSLAQGDFERTSGGLANQTRILRANIEDLEASVGAGLVPGVAGGVRALNGLLDASNRLIPALAVMKQGLTDVGGALEGTPLAPIVAGYRDLAGRLSLGADKTEDFATSTNKVVVAVRNEIAAQEKAAAQYRGAAEALRIATGASDIAAKSIRNLSENVLNAGANFAQLSVDALTAVQALEQAQGIARDLEGNPVLQEGPGSHAPGIQVTPVLIDFQTGLDRYRDALEASASRGVSSGIGSSEVEDSIDHVGEYLEAVARQRTESLSAVFDSISAHFSLQDAAGQVDEFTSKVAALKAEASGGKLAISQQQSLVGQLLGQSLQITPAEQVAIERAEKNLEDVKARFQGLVTQTAAPGSSFLGPTTIDQKNGPTATLAELQVAEQELAQAKADAVGPTRELEEAQKKLDDLRDRQKDLPGLIADAERDLARAKAGLVEAQRREVDTGGELVQLAPDIVDWYRQIGAQAGLSSKDIDLLTASLGAAAKAAGLVDVFNNGKLFQSPAEALQTINFVRGINGLGPISSLPGFAAGGTVPGFPGQPQLVLAHGGEKILTRGQQGGGTPINVTVNAGYGADGQSIARALRSELVAMARTGR